MDHNTSSIGDLIKAFLKANKLEDKMEEVDFRGKWEEIVGPMIAKHTVDIRLNSGKLTLRLNSAPLRHTLSFSKSEFIAKLNAGIGQELIREIELK
ncbi:MAG: DUF721 domain-containing protein [Vicingaceae bacterium]